MPFMIGKAPIRRTLQYLTAGKLVFKDKIKIMAVNYNTFDDHHAGAKDFVFWFLPQIQYKNPNVQIATFKNMTPTPFIKCYMDNGKHILIDIDSQTKEDVLAHLIRVVGKTESVLAAESILKEKKDNPANFGVACERACICEARGQVPCSGVVTLPKFMRGKYKYAK